jgi:DNA polymerase III subunit epsilon
MPIAFTAVDVEIANADFASICQVGIVQFEADAIVAEWQSLVNPEDYFDAVNVSIHGITDTMVASAPTWPQIHEAVTSRLQGHVVVCHTSFDRVSLARADSRYQLVSPAVTWLDSARVARRAWPDQRGKRGYGLRRLADLLSLTFTAHVAVEDARVAGLVVLRAISETGLGLADWLPRVQQAVLPVSGHASNPDGPLAGNVIVFTGTLSMVRGEAAAMAGAAGCDVRNTVTRDTTLLVVGDQDIRRLIGHEKSGKHRKAETLILAGQSIRIIAECDFISLLAVESVTRSVPRAS